MTAEVAFCLLNLLVLPVWATWLVAPRSRAAAALAGHGLVFLVPCALYAVLLGAALATGGAGGGLGYTGLREALATPLGFLAGWTHYLALDLFAGAWVLREARRLGLGARPYLLLTLLAGPLGLAAFLVRRTARLREFGRIGAVDLA